MERVYLHIPFCNSLCPYCDFPKEIFDLKKIDDYLEKLMIEVKSNYQGEKIKSIYIGGGTPSVLSVSQLKKLFSIIDLFKKKDGCEITFEVNCESIDLDKLKFLLDKVNRLSFGVQSFNDRLLKYLGRGHSGEMAFTKIKLAQELGFNNISVDLMYGMKGQTIADLQEDLAMIAELNVQHVSCYALMIKENTLFFKEEKNIDEDIEIEMYDAIVKGLKDFEHYEISNFAKPSFQAQHNLGYWKNESYYGFGMGAVGYDGNNRYYNADNLKGYFLNEKKVEKITDKEKLENEFILGLRLIKGINEKEFLKKYQKSYLEMPLIQQLIEKNDLCFLKGHLFIPKEKIYISNAILLKFINF